MCKGQTQLAVSQLRCDKGFGHSQVPAFGRVKVDWQIRIVVSGSRHRWNIQNRAQLIFIIDIDIGLHLVIPIAVAKQTRTHDHVSIVIVIPPFHFVCAEFIKVMQGCFFGGRAPCLLCNTQLR